MTNERSSGRYTFRKTEHGDLTAIMTLVGEAQRYIAHFGIDQWQDGYPQAELFVADMAAGSSYVFLEGDAVRGTAALSLAHEADYDQTDSGGWVCSGPYAVIHRLALADAARGTGLIDEIFSVMEGLAAEAGRSCLRIDTHAGNLAMRAVLRRNGFCYRGEIRIYRGTPYEKPRVIYEKQLSSSVERGS